ncbi:helix-turn-helix domain-containing protein [Parabacteroides sp. OttesenSCG-928-G06]|nr:helix-turn-helix domain-containing protein [Parabacteroides sp. OttesenSCG-928-G06]
MEILSIEGRTFEAMIGRFEQFVQKVDALCQQNDSKELGSWLDGQDVCEILNISKRKLQTLCDSRQIAFSMVGHKVYYKAEDVQKVIRKITERKEGENE